MYHVEVKDFGHWRKQARELLRRRVSPDTIAWQYENQGSLSFGDDENISSLRIQHPDPTISAAFFDIAKNAACYRDERRWSLLYSVAWRLTFEDRNLLDCKIDPQIARLFSMQKSVARDIHKMEAFVRFCRVENLPGEEDYFVAWFEPEHLIVPQVTPFFTKRFHNMRWSILTPDLCVHWDLKEVTYTKGAVRPPKVEDGLETLWREYYINIFNPARLKLKAMQSEMPKKYWVNLPEASLILELSRSAGNQVDTMVNREASQAWIKTARSLYVQQKQKELRSLRDLTRQGIASA